MRPSSWLIAEPEGPQVKPLTVQKASPPASPATSRPRSPSSISQPTGASGRSVPPQDQLTAWIDAERRKLESALGTALAGELAKIRAYRELFPLAKGSLRIESDWPVFSAVNTSLMDISAKNRARCRALSTIDLLRRLSSAQVGPNVGGGRDVPATVRRPLLCDHPPSSSRSSAGAHAVPGHQTGRASGRGSRR